MENRNWTFSVVACFTWTQDFHCVKSVRIRSYSGPYFPVFELNTKRYSVSLRIQSKCWKIRTRIIPNTGAFHAMFVSNTFSTIVDWPLVIINIAKQNYKHRYFFFVWLCHKCFLRNLGSQFSGVKSVFQHSTCPT